MNRVRRLWGIRHVRWLRGVIGLEIHLSRWASLGFPAIPQQSDVEMLNAIWRGDA